MGADIQDCGNIGKLIGYKIMGSAALSYMQLSIMSDNRKVFHDYMESTNGTGTYRYIRDDLYLDGWNKTLQYGYITVRKNNWKHFFLNAFFFPDFRYCFV